jgi:Leucine-rich repeat (LRR) protein
MSLLINSSKHTFLSFPEDVVRKIFNFSGELSKLSVVCKAFNKHATEEGRAILKKAENEFSPQILAYVLAQLPTCGRSIVSRVDALFNLAKSNAANQRIPIANGKSPYDTSHLKTVFDPYFYSTALFSLWNAVFDEGPYDLKIKMESVRLHKDPNINIQQMHDFFESHQQELEVIQKINLIKMDIRVLPAEIAYFKDLRVLDISENKLTHLPDLSALKQLRYLNLNDNQFAQLPPSIGELPNLSVLSAMNNQLVYVDESIGNLSQLKNLYLGGNQIACLPEKIGQLISLEECSLENNCLKALPESIGALKQLKYLYLYNNQLTSFPASIKDLESLRVLSAPRNQIVSLAEDLDSLKNLHALILDKNALKALPSCIGKMKSLLQLSVSENQLTKAPRYPFLHFFCYEGNPCALQNSNNFSRGLKTKDEFLEIYEGLGEDKWKENVEGIFHGYGKFVFDRGLHGRAIEPGFMQSIENLYEFLKANYGRKIDADFYLEMHRVACAHFKGKDTQTLIDQKKVGLFRNRGVGAEFAEPHCKLTEKGFQDHSALSQQLSRVLGFSFSLGQFIRVNPTTWRLFYYPMHEDLIRIVFNFFITEFYAEIARAQSRDEYLKAIAKLIQHLEWLHPPEDGCGRVDTALLHFLLASYADLNPALLSYTYVSSCYGLEEWVQYLNNGIEDWKAECDAIEDSDGMEDYSSEFDPMENSDN